MIKAKINLKLALIKPKKLQDDSTSREALKRVFKSPSSFRIARAIASRSRSNYSLRPEAEDLLQMAAIKALTANTSFQQEASARTWFIAILRNTIGNEIAKAKGKLASAPRVKFDDNDPESEALTVPNPEDHNVLELDLERLLGTLSPREEQTLKSLVNGDDHQTIEELLGISNYALRRILKNIRKKLQPALDKN